MLPPPYRESRHPGEPSRSCPSRQGSAAAVVPIARVTPATTLAQMEPVGTLARVAPATTLSQVVPAGTLARVAPAETR